MTDNEDFTADMKIEEVYQILKFEIISGRDPFFNEKVAIWFPEHGAENLIPEDTLTRLYDEDLYLIMNTGTGEIGEIGAADLALKFEASDDAEEFQGKRRSFVSRILKEFTEVSAEEESEDYFRAMNDALRIISEVGGLAE